MVSILRRSKPGLEILALVSAAVLIGVPVAFLIMVATEHLVRSAMTWVM